MKTYGIKISTRSTKLLGNMRSSTGLTPNILARFGLCLSLRQRGIPNPDEYNKDGSDFTAEVLFGKHKPIYLALLINRLRKDGLDAEYLDDQMRAHLNRGILSLRQRVDDLSDFYELVKEARGN